MKGEIIITAHDYTKLCEMLSMVREQKTIELKNIEVLGSEIKRARKVDPRTIVSDVVTMNSEIEVVDMDTNKPMRITLVYPEMANIRESRVSVLSPLGSALLGYKTGDTITFEVPKGTKKIRIDKIIYQPEASGNYNE